MNRGALNSYTINGRSPRGGAVRVAADLIGYAIVAASARIHRRYIGPITAQATVPSLGGRRSVQLGAIAANEARITLVAGATRVRAVVSAIAEAVVTLRAKAGRRAIFGVDSQAQVNLVGRAFRRGPMPQTGQATATGRLLQVWRRAPVVTLGVAGIANTARTFRLQLVRLFAQFTALVSAPAIPGRVAVSADIQAVAQARIRLSAGVQNDFPYDEDAPEERTFIVAGEDNIFYVVD